MKSLELGKKNKDKDDDKGKELSKYDKEYFKDKMCFRCGKTGHPKSACTAKMPDNDEASQSSKSSKSSLSSSKHDQEEADDNTEQRI